jgi:hypothetical protein
MILLILIVLLFMIFGSAPNYPYSRGWGMAPSGVFGFIMLVLLLLLVFGYIPR